ncbi:hypothetical protein JCM9957A_21920 [Kineosporia succinea]
MLLADGQERVEVGRVGLHDVHGQAGQVVGQLGGAALQEHALLAGVGQGADGVGADEAESAGHEDHEHTFR